jgi:MFS transporter, DHA1 family, tetracycline resistance protein
MKRSRLAILFVTVFVDLLGFGIVLPMLPYYAESYGASPLVIGLLSTSYSLMQFVFTPVWGRLSDRYGRRPMILRSLAGSCVGFLIFGLAHSLPVLFAGRILAGIAGAIIPTTSAYIADVTPPEQRAKGMGMIGAAFGLGFIFGPAIGGLLSPFGYDKPALLASALAGVNLVFAHFMLPESLSEENRTSARRRRFDMATLFAALRDPRIGVLLAIYFVATFAFSNMEATFALLNEHRYGLNARQTGYLFTYIGLLATLMQGVFAARAVRRWGEARCVTTGTFLMIFALGLMPIAPGLPAYCAVIALLSIGSGLNAPALSALLSRSAHGDEQGGIMGIAQSLASLGRIFGPVWGGYTFGALGLRWPFLTGALFMGAAFLLSLRLDNLGAASPAAQIEPQP